MNKKISVIPFERIAEAIHVIRAQKVMLDRDLAALYGVPTKALKQAVRRNRKRFPVDFMFELTHAELANWRSQFVTSNKDRMGLRHAPMAFTEQGVAMLSSVLNSQQAVDVNIAIMRAFVRLREFLASQAKLGKKLTKLERTVEEHHESIHMLITAIQELSTERPSAIGFQYSDSDGNDSASAGKVKESRPTYRTKRKH